MLRSRRSRITEKLLESLVFLRHIAARNCTVTADFTSSSIFYRVVLPGLGVGPLLSGLFMLSVSG